MVVGVIDVVILLTSAQLLIFALFLAFAGLRRRRELLYLALFFFSLAANILNYFLFRRIDYFFPGWIHFIYLGAPFAFLYAPCLYLYVRDSTRPATNAAARPPVRPAAAARTLLHCAPFAAFTAYLCAAFYFHDAEAKQRIIWAPDFLPNYGYKALTAVLQAQILFYIVLCVRRLVLYRLRLKKSFSSLTAVTFAWLGKLAFGAAALWILDLVRFAGRFADRNPADWSASALWIVFALFCCLFLYNVLQKPRVLFEAEEEPSRRPKKSLSDKTAGDYRRKLARLMETEKPHVEHDLSLAGLSDLSGIPARSLTETIRASGSDNFYDFVNEYRVREFLDFLSDPVRKSETVLALMFDAGFNSKSAFNRAFKKKTGKNPRQYLKSRSA
ncbi:MAG: AraC family transcriptional regulator [Spirochaetales bacterium]|nr:AraC family transcriptional regulator [Spirochaetales bacterium]